MGMAESEIRSRAQPIHTVSASMSLPLSLSLSLSVLGPPPRFSLDIPMRPSDTHSGVWLSLR